jgi:hypothetical protein
VNRYRVKVCRQNHLDPNHPEHLSAQEVSLMVWMNEGDENDRCFLGYSKDGGAVRNHLHRQGVNLACLECCGASQFDRRVVSVHPILPDILG